MRLLLILILSTFCFSAIAKNKKVLLVTTLGTIKLELFDDVPLHSKNFLTLIKNKNLDSTLFHRVIKNFMVQAGDPDSKRAKALDTLGNGDLGYTIPAEFNYKKYFHVRGVLAMARDDRPDKASSACQFYIVQGKKYTTADFEKLEKRRGVPLTEEQKTAYTTLGGAGHLDNNYTVFGKVLKGMGIVDAIANIKTDGNNRPLTDIRILKTKIIRRKFLGIF